MSKSARRIEAHDLDGLSAAVRLFEASRGAGHAWLPLSQAAEGADAYFRERVAPEATLLGAYAGEELVGFIAFDAEWIWHLYVKPGHERQGHGSALIDHAFDVAGPKKAFVYQDNEDACAFYESKGFVGVAFGDGSRNAGKRADVLYLWGRAEG